MKCIEIIILKQASVIGNIFDIDILGDLMSSFSTTFDDLLDAIKNFESLGIIEILYDIKLKHLVAMFSLPLMREVLYQDYLSNKGLKFIQESQERWNLVNIVICLKKLNMKY